MTLAEKHDAGKPRPELLPPRALLAVADVAAYGARKYAVHNRARGLAWSRLLGAALRHLLAWAGGENDDPESGLPHLAHAACSVLFLLEYELRGAGGDDRPGPEIATAMREAR